LLAFSIKENVVLDSHFVENQLNSVINIVGISDKVVSLKLGLDTPIDKSFDKDGVNLSEGENQKIAIARAIYRNSPIIILDEPTASLDPIAESEVYRSFDQLIGNKTATYISHRLSSCCFCDKIAVFDNGRIVEYGSHEELLKMGELYSKMWNAQAQWYVSGMTDIV
jgi:ATP-binding cassette subfamily B protein